MAIPFLDNIEMNSNSIVNLANPSSNNDATNKIYVDNKVANLHNVINNEVNNAINIINNSLFGMNSGIYDTISNLNSNIYNELNNRVADNLSTPNNLMALSANQGVVLNSKISNLAATINLVGVYDNETIKCGSLMGSDIYSLCVVMNLSNAITNITIDLSNNLLNTDFIIDAKGFATVSNSLDYMSLYNNIGNIYYNSYNMETRQLILDVDNNLINNFTTNDKFCLMLQVSNLSTLI